MEEIYGDNKLLPAIGERKNGLPNARRESNSAGSIANEKDYAILERQYSSASTGITGGDGKMICRVIDYY